VNEMSKDCAIKRLVGSSFHPDPQEEGGVRGLERGVEGDWGRVFSSAQVVGGKRDETTLGKSDLRQAVRRGSSRQWREGAPHLAEAFGKGKRLEEVERNNPGMS